MTPRTLVVLLAVLVTMIVLSTLDPRLIGPQSSPSTTATERQLPPPSEATAASVAAPVPTRSVAAAQPAEHPAKAPSPTWVAAESAELADLASKDALLALNTTPEHRERRAIWAREAPDETWTRQMREELTAKVRGNVDGDVKVSHLSCRETICRMFLHFDTHQDAENFISIPYDASLDYLFQSLDPDYDKPEHERSDFSHELMIKRPRPGTEAAAAYARSSTPAGDAVLLGRSKGAPALPATE